MYFYLGKNACSVFIHFGDNENFCLATNELCVFLRGSFEGSRIFLPEMILRRSFREEV